MTQRIVIKTSVNRVPQANEKVSYQWHWRRIFAASSIVLLFAVALAYGLMNSVNADELATQSEPSQAVLTQQVSDSLSDAPKELSAHVLSDQETELLEAADGRTVQTKQNEVAQVDTALANASTETETEVDASTLVAPDNERVIEPKASEAHGELAQQNDDVEVSINEFAEGANVKSVALGAQIDTNFVSRAVLTTGVVAREPIDVLKENLDRGAFDEKLYFFTEVNNMQGQTIQHLWFHQDQLMAEISLEISAVRFRTYSSKNIMPSQTGPWRVEVVTEQGELLAQKSFRIISQAQ